MKFILDGVEISVSVGDMRCWWDKDIYLITRVEEHCVDLLLVCVQESSGNFVSKPIFQQEYKYSKRRFQYSLEHDTVCRLC